MSENNFLNACTHIGLTIIAACKQSKTESQFLIKKLSATGSLQDHIVLVSTYVPPKDEIFLINQKRRVLCALAIFKEDRSGHTSKVISKSLIRCVRSYRQFLARTRK